MRIEGIKNLPAACGHSRNLVSQGENPLICEHCGRAIPPDAAECPHHRIKESPQSWPPDLVLLSTVPIVIVLFVVTGFAAKFYHAQERALGQQWYAQGEKELKNNQSSAAVESIRNALVYSRDNRLYRLRLAESLMAAQRNEEARAYLLNLWEEEPGNASVNLNLAHLAAQRGDFPKALRYYHGAIYGVWESDPQSHRLQTRLDFCRFLLSQAKEKEAQSELIALAANLPEDSPLHPTAGHLFLTVKDFSHALKEFQRGLQRNRTDPFALRGAGDAAFQMKNYREAEHYFDALLRENPQEAEVNQKLQISRLLLTLDPSVAQLSAQERNRRIVTLFDRTLSRFIQCAAQRNDIPTKNTATNNTQTLHLTVMKLRFKINEKNLNRHSDLADNTMNLIFQMRTDVASQCGVTTPLDQALALMARKNGGRNGD